MFIIKEQSRDKGEYEAFVTSGGIQQVKPVWSSYGYHQSQFQPGQPTVQEDEDPDYFAVMVTQETVSQLQYSKNATIKAPLSVLLVAASSRLPWLLVLRRESYPQFFDYPPAAATTPATAVPYTASAYTTDGTPTSTAAAAAGSYAGGLPLQVPLRRHYYTDRQRRGLFGSYSESAERTPYVRYRTSAAEQEANRIVPLLFERDLMSTMCYNFMRDYAISDHQTADSPTADQRREYYGEEPAVLDPVAEAFSSAQPKDDRQASVAQASAAQASAAPASATQAAAAQAVPMTIPKRVST